MTTRDIIHDTQAVFHEAIGDGVRIDNDGNYINLSRADYNEIASAIEKLGETLTRKKQKKGEHSFHFNGRMYKFDVERCSVTKNSYSSYKADLAIHRPIQGSDAWTDKDDKTKRIRVTYSLYKHNTTADKKKGYRLAFIGNPTSIVSGNNVSPIRVDNVSSLQETLTFYRIGFSLLEAILDRPFNSDISRELSRGEQSTSNTQWAFYFPSKYKALDLNYIAGIFCSSLISKKYMKLGEYLGFSTAETLKSGTANKLSGVFLTKKSGTNHVLTVNFYDKEQSLANMKLLGTLTNEELKLVQNAIRVDITAHTIYLQRMIKQAYNLLIDELLPLRPTFEKKLSKFIHEVETAERIEKIRCTAYMICRAMSLLAFRVEEVDGKKVVKQYSFTEWLAREILEEELCLSALLEGNPNKISFANNTKFPKMKEFVAAWKSFKHDEDTESDKPQKRESRLKSYIMEETGMAERTYTNYRAHLKEEYNLDMRIPYQYWVDQTQLSATYGLTLDERAQYIECLIDSKMSSRKRIEIMNVLGRKRDRRLKTRQVTLLTSLKLAAKQIPANKVNLALIFGPEKGK